MSDKANQPSAEQKLRRDPVTWLRRICEHLEEQAKESPFTREEWDRVDRDTVKLREGIRKAITHLRTIVEPYEGESLENVPPHLLPLREVLDALREALT